MSAATKAIRPSGSVNGPRLTVSVTNVDAEAGQQQEHREEKLLAAPAEAPSPGFLVVHRLGRKGPVAAASAAGPSTRRCR
jgi:hypothetical protein